MEKPWLDSNIISLSHIINESYNQFFGNYFFDNSLNKEEISTKLYFAPFVVLAHNHSSDPIFTYANDCAQKLWGYSWKEFIGMPSRLSAGTTGQTDRNEFLQEVEQNGFGQNYNGIRIDKHGNSFKIINTKLWNLNSNDAPVGQAAMFESWEFQK